MSRAAPILAAALLCAGCAQWDEAYRDRVAHERPAVDFGCGEPPPALEPFPRGGRAIRVRVEGAPDPSPPIVGRLPSHDPAGTPIEVLGPGPNEVIVADLRRALARRGFAVVDSDADVDRVFFADVLVADVCGAPVRWYQRNRVVATLEVHLEARDAKRVVWEEDLNASSELRTLYFLSSDAERTLGRAYCGWLGELERALASPEVERALR